MAGAVAVSVELLPDGALAEVPVGTHAVLEAGGALLHAVRLPDGYVALRAGSVRRFQLARQPPRCAAVWYPQPLGPACDAERAQAAERGRAFLGLGAAEVAARLVGAGGSAALLEGGGEALAAECLAGLCATGFARHWGVAEAYRAACGAASLAGAAADAGAAPPPPPAAGPAPSTPRTSAPSPAPPERHGGVRAAASAPRVEAEGSHARLAAAALPAPGADATLDRAVGADVEAWTDTAVQTAVHAGLRGPATRLAGAAAAMGCEGYALYKEVREHADKYKRRDISGSQYEEKVAESAITSSGRAMGGLCGAAVGQAALPVPIVGAVVGGLVGATAGGLHASSLVRGMSRLSGGKAKGGDDLVRVSGVGIHA
ncbi:unnamed protein product [Prorocentrum cordatum]|uniref:Uncharacterized protein n=1 Tax=Prorocentrum cordatum TaxID=2364126 RepID=A0ABN9X574_9DINO|nr:unnamed protein product [Polarella glacialis]